MWLIPFGKHTGGYWTWSFSSWIYPWTIVIFQSYVSVYRRLFQFSPGPNAHVPGAEITSSKRFAKPCSASASGEVVGGTKAARSVSRFCKAYTGEFGHHLKTNKKTCKKKTRQRQNKGHISNLWKKNWKFGMLSNQTVEFYNCLGNKCKIGRVWPTRLISK